MRRAQVRSRLLAGLIVGALSLATLPGQGQAQSAPSDEDRRVGQEFFDSGAKFFVAGDYAAAIVEFRKGYARLPEPLFLYNIALAETRLGRYQQALQTSERAEKVLAGDSADANKGLQAACTTIIDAGKRAEAIALALAQAAAEPQIEEPKESVEAVEAVAVVVEPQPQPTGFGALGWTGVGVATLGGLALAGAGLTIMSLESDWQAYEEAARLSDGARYSALSESIEDQQIVGQVLLYSGVGLVAVGSGLIIYELVRSSGSQDRQPGVVLAPTVGREAVALELRLRF
ncbi:MAG: hypothetical protein H0U74_02235 [Bradymonadaceae bacterium]|nr:hypothetical protein [Lujinxingiaceae bacterium]